MIIFLCMDVVMPISYVCHARIPTESGGEERNLGFRRTAVCKRRSDCPITAREGIPGFSWKCCFDLGGVVEEDVGSLEAVCGWVHVCNCGGGVLQPTGRGEDADAAARRAAEERGPGVQEPAAGDVADLQAGGAGGDPEGAERVDTAPDDDERAAHRDVRTRDADLALLLP